MNYFFGLQVKQEKDGIFISQAKYAKNLVKKFGLERSKAARSPMSTCTKFHKDLSGKDVDQTLHRSMMGSPLYLTASRPDIAFVVGVCARFQSRPEESHLLEIKRIIKYMGVTTDFILQYTHDTKKTWLDTMMRDGARCIDYRKSTYRGAFFVVNNRLHGIARSKIVSHYLMLKQNIWRLEAIALSWCG